MTFVKGLTMTNNVVSQDEIIRQNEVLEMARQAGFWKDLFAYAEFKEHLETFAKLVDARATAKEREACLKICEAQAQTNYWEGADVCAEDIRARGSNE